jgi:hypothetical protein
MPVKEVTKLWWVIIVFAIVVPILIFLAIVILVIVLIVRAKRNAVVNLQPKDKDGYNI